MWKGFFTWKILPKNTYSNKFEKIFRKLFNDIKQNIEITMSNYLSDFIGPPKYYSSPRSVPFSNGLQTSSPKNLENDETFDDSDIMKEETSLCFKLLPGKEHETSICFKLLPESEQKDFNTERIEHFIQNWFWIKTVCGGFTLLTLVFAIVFIN